MYGFIIEKDIAAKNVDAWNRSVINTTEDVPAGAPLVLTAPEKAEEPWTAAKPSAGTLGDVWVAYPSSEALAGWSGNVYAGLSADPRDYTNLKGRPFDAFKVQKHDIVGFTKDCFDSSLTNSTTVGTYFETKADQYEWTCTATATAGSTAFKIISNGTLPFPAAQDTIGLSQYQFVVGECIAD